MQNEQNNFRRMSSALILLPVTTLAVSVQGCAYQEKTPVNMQAQATTKVEQQPVQKLENPAPPPAPVIEHYALDRLRICSISSQ
ncbi:MAG: hypothetical protein PHG00_18030 [Methylococcales bacterium]|nr:hypothetical protein [Methylococcales bacterium]